MAITSGIFEIKLFGQVQHGSGAVKNFLNVFHYYQIVPSSTFGDPAAFLNSFNADVTTYLLPLLSADYKVIKTTGRWLDNHENPEAILVGTGSGTKAGDTLPDHNCVTFQLKSNIQGRCFKGSKHFGGVVEADTQADELVDPALTGWKNFIANLLVHITVAGADHAPCILSRKNSQLLKNPVTLSAAAVTACLLNKTIGSMRKRKEKTVLA